MISDGYFIKMIENIYRSTRKTTPISSKFCIFKENESRMILERTKDEILVRLPANMDITELQNMLDYLDYKEKTADSKATQKQVDELARTVNKKMWTKFKAQRNK
ncbi:MAG: hypothetical protein PWR04_3 [Anaerophaga sp.]|nr:hypothetical protein [Anaerophaga sp.]